MQGDSMITKLIRISTISLILFAALLLYTGLVSAHGKVSLENDSCVRGIEGSMVHLSAYQPQYDPEAEYCTEIPNEGKTFWVIDLIDQALRDMPIAVRIVKGTGEKLSETVANFHSTYHPEGVIKGESNLDGGQYTVFVTGEGVPPVQYEYPLRVQMINYADTFRAAIVPMIVLFLLALIANKYLKSRRMQQP
jgi:hypothetical protein